MKRALIFLIVLTLGATVWAGDFRMPPGKWWENPRVVERLHITAEQQQQIHDLVYRHAQRMIDLNAAVKRAELELGDLAEREELDADAARAAFARFQQARQKLETERFELLVGVRQLLTAQQWRDINTFRQEIRRRVNDRRRPGMRDRFQPRRSPPR